MLSNETKAQEQYRHGFIVLNPDSGISETGRVIGELEKSGKIIVRELDMFDYEVTRESGLIGYTVMVMFKIEPGEKVLEETDSTNNYIGYYIGEEYHGLPHPFLLLPPDQVQQKSE